MRREDKKTTWQSGTEETEEFEAAIGIASDFLGRWCGTLNATQRDDLGLQAAVLAIQRLHTLRDKRSFPAFVRTIARRQRALAVRERVKLRAAGLEDDFEIREELPEPSRETRWYSVSGLWIQDEEMMRVLPDVLGQLSRLNVALLLSYYEGFSCSELAERFDLTIERVKVRIHRSRRRVRVLFERRAESRSSGLRTGTFPGPNHGTKRPGATEIDEGRKHQGEDR